jgi:hypothetical protein
MVEKVQPALGQVLRTAAAVAATQPAEPRPGPGQYFYTRSREAYLTSVGFNPRCATHPCDREHPWEETREWSALAPRIRQTWIAANGAGRARVVSTKPEFLTAGQRRAWKAAGSPHLGSGGVEDFALSGQPFLDTSNLPTQPKALRRLIEARKIPLVDGPPGEAETFALIGDMLRSTYLPPAFRAALYRVVAELPKVELLGEVEDPIDRKGIGVAYTKGSLTPARRARSSSPSDPRPPGPGRNRNRLGHLPRIKGGRLARQGSPTRRGTPAAEHRLLRKTIPARQRCGPPRPRPDRHMHQALARRRNGHDPQAPGTRRQAPQTPRQDPQPRRLRRRIPSGHLRIPG